jgi:hypothetical protein
MRYPSLGRSLRVLVVGLVSVCGTVPASHAFTLINFNSTVEKASGGPTIVPNGGSIVANGPRYSVDDSGCFVVFTSAASNLTGSTDLNGQTDVFLYQGCGNGTITLISHVGGNTAVAANGASDQPVISPDSRYVVFRSTANNLVPASGYAAGRTNIFLWDSTSPTTFQLVSHVTGATTQAGNGSSQNAVISRGGGTPRFVAFESVATDLLGAGNDNNGVADVFRFDSSSPTIVRASARNATGDANGASTNPDIDSTGSCIVYQSAATNIITGQSEANGGTDVFKWTSAGPTSILLSHHTGSTTQTGNGVSTEPSIDDSCSRFAFKSAATDLVATQGEGNAGTDVFWARNTGDAALASHRALAPAVTGNGVSDSPTLSRNGNFVAYASLAKNLVNGAGAPLATSNVFLYDIGSDSNTLVSHTAGNTAVEANGQSFAPEISTEGLYVAFASDATDLDPNQNDNNIARDVFLYNARWNNSIVASRRYASIAITGDQHSLRPAVSGNGFAVAFQSPSDDLLADDPETGGLDDVFLFGASSFLPFVSVRSTQNTNTLEWVLPPVNYVTMQLYVAAASTCSSLTFTDPAWVSLGVASPPSNTRALFTDPTAYAPGTDRCYGLFVEKDGSAILSTDTPARSITAHTLEVAPGPVKWVSNIAAVSSLSQVGLGGPNLTAVANEGGVYALTKGATGGFWPSTYRPYRTNLSAIQGRPPVLALSVLGSTNTAFVGSQDGRVYAFDADRGARVGGALWYTSPALGTNAQAGIAGMFTMFGGVGNHLLIGSRNGAGAAQFFALDPATGTPRVGSPFSGGGSVGAINATASVDYTAKQVYFASLEFAAGQPSLWCLTLTASGLGGPCWNQTSPGPITGGPVQRSGRVYVGDDNSQVWAFNASGGGAAWPGPYALCGGGAAIKSFVLPDRLGTAQDLYYATSLGLCAVTDTGPSPASKWSIPSATIPGPSAPVLARIAGIAYIYVGATDGRLYEIPANTPGAMKSVLLRPGATIGPPAFDSFGSMIYAGSDAGGIYAVQVPLP